MELSSYRIQAFHPDENQIELTHDLHLIEERREEALLRLAASKERIVRYYNAKVRNRPVREGKWVLKINFKHIPSHGKFTSPTPQWEGPYKVRKVVGPNTVKLSLPDGQDMSRTWNTMHLRRYFTP
ncbi:unnamed protein product [Linum trigynum]|uniref:Uncharacterized protein n=1 Tax=Linum trigynum TaxID=586398 RepID=A0AAV2F7U2_9ROSI